MADQKDKHLQLLSGETHPMRVIGFRQRRHWEEVFGEMEAVRSVVLIAQKWVTWGSHMQEWGTQDHGSSCLWHQMLGM